MATKLVACRFYKGAHRWGDQYDLEQRRTVACKGCGFPHPEPELFELERDAGDAARDLEESLG